MPASTFQKKATFFLIFSGIIILVLIGFPLLESWLQDNILPRFALRMTEGRVVNADGSDAGMMSTTTVSLVINIFHIVKIFLWMALVISFIRFVRFLIFETALGRSGKSEISS